MWLRDLSLSLSLVCATKNDADTFTSGGCLFYHETPTLVKIIGQEKQAEEAGERAKAAKASSDRLVLSRPQEKPRGIRLAKGMRYANNFFLRGFFDDDFLLLQIWPN